MKPADGGSPEESEIAAESGFPESGQPAAGAAISPRASRPWPRRGLRKEPTLFKGGGVLRVHEEDCSSWSLWRADSRRVRARTAAMPRFGCAVKGQGSCGVHGSVRVYGAPGGRTTQTARRSSPRQTLSVASRTEPTASRAAEDVPEQRYILSISFAILLSSCPLSLWRLHIVWT